MKIEGGYTVDGNECNAKYINLLQTYRHNKDKRLKTTGESKITWEYYCIFDNVLGTKDSSRPREELLSTSLQNSDENKCQEDDSQPGTSGLQKKTKNSNSKTKE
ncbi:unnamed protein product [Psylliodes chrysocephalus]|uniref:Uncharacterized protein n=1 Tax=Psylliodes chrysocephalus TaxID=3402493 RepID=A0A9P0GII7_9CUCU|nr:unnamed protein product [Psylliodes chrysocephala]